jgi:hypothetical protein
MFASGTQPARKATIVGSTFHGRGGERGEKE